MHNWYLLLLAFVAVLQPIASFTERNLVDGREQCSDHRADLYDSRFYGTVQLSPNRKNYHSEKRDERHIIKEEPVFTRPLSSRLVDHQERDIGRGFRARISPVNLRSDNRKSERQYREEKEHIIRKSDSRRDFARAERGEHNRQVFRDLETTVARYDNRFAKGPSTHRDSQTSRIPILARRKVQQHRDNSEEHRLTRENNIHSMRERNDVTHSNDARRARINEDELRQVRARLVRETRDERVEKNYRVSTLKRVAEYFQTRIDTRRTRDERQLLTIRENHDMAQEHRTRDTSDESRRFSREEFSQLRDETRGRNRDTRSDSRLSLRQARESVDLNMKAELRLVSRVRQSRKLNRNLRSGTRFNTRDQETIREMRRSRERSSDRSQTDRKDYRSVERLVNQANSVRETKILLNHFRDAEGRHLLRDQIRQLERNSRNSRPQLNTRERISQANERNNAQSMERFSKRQSYDSRPERNNQESDIIGSFNSNIRENPILERDLRRARDVRTPHSFNQMLVKGNTRIETAYPETRREKSREREIRSRDNLASARREHKLFDQRREIRLVTRSRSINPVQANDMTERNMERDIKNSRFFVESNRRSSSNAKNSFTEGVTTLNWHHLFYALQGLYICGVLLQIKSSDNGKKSRSFNIWPSIFSFKTIKVD